MMSTKLSQEADADEKTGSEPKLSHHRCLSFIQFNINFERQISVSFYVQFYSDFRNLSGDFGETNLIKSPGSYGQFLA